MDKIKVAILFGGQSTEHRVSLESAAAVIEHIPRDFYEPLLIGITENGKWLRFEGGPDRIRDGTWHEHPSCRPAVLSPDASHRGLLVLQGDDRYERVGVDCAFPVLHGRGGEDGTVQGLLELAGIPYVGCGLLSSAISMDKTLAQDLVKQAGIPTTEYFYFTERDERILSALDKQVEWRLGGYPVFVKPANSGSSVGITKVRGPEALEAAVRHAFRFDGKVICEKEVPGIEVGCAVYGNDRLETGVIGEIEPSREFLDYEDKYLLGEIRQHVPARINPALQEEVKRLGMEVFRLLGCRGLARVDFFVTREGRVLFNEINTMPGFTASSRYPRMIEAAGIRYSDFLDKLIRLAFGEG
ncbi:D-alanine--D-alanine ligase family protein [Cohnella caldifontis]|uniref:D-alanine--D-alanine ligase family protein n=1 Tax=Cohnella caldifontis TaxID=3027471 RepID=UPI0023EE1F6D|nr:D-alanine--D-alanine ligase family protein [Cohnella sp. YIM B05605]